MSLWIKQQERIESYKLDNPVRINAFKFEWICSIANYLGRLYKELSSDFEQWTFRCKSETSSWNITQQCST